MSEVFDFDREYTRLSFDAAERAGFRVPLQLLPGSREARLTQVETRRRRALWALEELQVLACHDDPYVGRSARGSLHECLNMVVKEAPSRKPLQQLERVFGIAESVVKWLWELGHDGRYDPENADPNLVRRIRSVLLLWMFLAASATAVLTATGQYGYALTFLASAVAADVAEGAVERLTGTESPVERWLACLVGHLSELSVIVGIAWDQQRLGHPSSASAVLIAGLVAIFGTFVRVSAIQAGICFWRSMTERAVRLSSMIAYMGASLVLTGTRLPATAGLAAALIFGSFGLWEGVRFGISKGLKARKQGTTAITVVVSDSHGRVAVRSVDGSRPTVLGLASDLI